MSRRHHFVSQFHLRHFVDPDSAKTPDPWVWVGDLETKAVKRRAPKNLAWSPEMFDGPGCLADNNARLEDHLANTIESPAARALGNFAKSARRTRPELPPSLMRYVAWAATRNLPMADLFQNWVSDDVCGRIVEPPPVGWE